MSSKPKGAFYRRARFRLTLFYTTIQFICLVLLCAFLHYRNNRSLHKQLERFLKDEARGIMLRIPDHPGGWPAFRNSLKSESRGERYYRMSFRLLDRDGKLHQECATHTLRDQSIAPLTPEARQTALDAENRSETVLVPDPTTPDQPEPHVLMTFPVKNKEDTAVVYILQVLAERDRLDRLSRHFLHNIYSAIPILILISWFSGYAIVRRFLRPVHTMARTARRITSTNLSERLVRTYSNDEFDRLAATLNDMIGRLEESFGLLRQFAADAAHELRTPLTILKGETELALRSRSPDPQTYRNALQSNIQECDRMIAVVGNLLTLCQADAGDDAVAHEPVRLDLILAELAETFLTLAEHASLTLEAPDTFPPTLVLGERSRLHELFANLLDNAVKYTPPGGRVTLSCERGTDEARVHIADTGVGIPEDEQHRIYERFYRVDHSRSRQTGGSGLGLSIARWIANAHSGTIDVDSAPGAGSTFTVALPLAPAPEAESPGEARAQTPADASHSP